MRLLKLTVRNFQALASAEVEFGAGLNVLFGPNDLGKSTLATAIRAALLVPTGSAAARPFLPWHSGSSPEVSLTLSDDQHHYWKIRKSFGESSGEAELFHSKDGNAFTLDCRGRQVEERIRRLLDWGIPPPGGKGAPRGMPVSFLAKALLAEQTEVDDILSASVAEDSDESGKLRLVKALTALAQDPTFKRVLAQAQQEADQYFTASGKPKRGQGSAFSQRADVVRRHSQQLAELQKQVEESASAEAAIARRSEHRAEVEVQVEEATSGLEAQRARQRRAGEREAAVQRLAQARQALGEIDARVAAVGGRERGIEQLLATLQGDEERAGEQSRAVASAEAALQELEDQLRRAQSADGERERELRRARLERTLAELSGRATELEQCKQRAEAGVAALTSMAAAGAGVQAAAQAHRLASEAARVTSSRLEQSEAELELARATSAYARWVASTEAAALCAEAGAAARQARVEAEAKQRAALEHEATSSTIDAQVARERARLPDAARLEELGRLEHSLALAEASLGGGMSIALRGTGKLNVRAQLDGGDVTSHTRLDGKHVLQADGRAMLSIDDALEIEIIAGAPEKRHELETLRERWEQEGLAVMRQAGAASLLELRRSAEALHVLVAQAEQHHGTALRLRAEIETLATLAGAHDARVEELRRRAARAGEWEAALGAHDREVLSARLRKLQPPSEETAERAHTACEELGRRARQDTEVTTRKLNDASHAVAEQRAVFEARRAEAERLRAAVTDDPGADMATIMHESATALDALQTQRAEQQLQLQAVAADGARTIELAERAVERAGHELEALRAKHRVTREAIVAKRSDLDIRRGELSALQGELDKLDPHAARTAVQRCESEVDSFAGDPPFAPAALLQAEQAVNSSRRALELATRELDRARGALSHIGGNAAAEDLKRVEEAVERAKQQERELDIEAESWKLLRETLREVENDEGSHLGRALATPVTTRFVELTGARYEGLRLDAHLTAEHVVLPGGTGQALSALSVGTREQLATLLRLTIAEQLGCTVVLDDHLVQTDTARLEWFRAALRRAAVVTQVIVFTCRPRDYVSEAELPEGLGARDLAGGLVRAVDLAPLLHR